MPVVGPIKPTLKFYLILKTVLMTPELGVAVEAGLTVKVLDTARLSVTKVMMREVRVRRRW